MRSSKSRSGIIHASPRTEARDRNGSSLTHHILERLPAREAPVVSGRVIGRGRRFALTEITGVEIPEEVLDADGVRTAIARIDGAVGQNPELAEGARFDESPPRRGVVETAAGRPSCLGVRVR